MALSDTDDFDDLLGPETPEPEPTDSILRFLTIAQVEDRTSLARRTIYRDCKEGRFPQPVEIGGRRKAWIESEIVAWQRAWVEARR